MKKVTDISQLEGTIAFFVSSVGDTDLAKSTISRLFELGLKETILVIPVAKAANDRVADLSSNPQIKIVPLDKIIQQPNIITKKKISSDELQLIIDFILEYKIQRAFIGVTSVLDEEVPFQIASAIPIPCTIAYEFMFKPAKHCFWSYVPELASKQQTIFSVPLKSAFADFLKLNPQARVKATGHLCIDRAQNPAKFDKQTIKESLGVKLDQDLTFISGTTQPIEVDNFFLDALLQELSTGNYLQYQIRFGLHPGIKDLDLYLQTLFTTYDKYPKAKSQFKIVLTETLLKRLANQQLKDHDCILLGNISGSDMALAAERVAQSVPGALLNESALVGKPSYFHDKSTTPYLPEKWFARSISEFFDARSVASHNREELELSESAPFLVAMSLLE